MAKEGLTQEQAEGFGKRLIDASTHEDIVALASEYGIDLGTAPASESGEKQPEIADDDLASVAGGAQADGWYKATVEYIQSQVREGVLTYSEAMALIFSL